jgi:hypothetical protein
MQGNTLALYWLVIVGPHHRTAFSGYMFTAYMGTRDALTLLSVIGLSSCPMLFWGAKGE